MQCCLFVGRLIAVGSEIDICRACIANRSRGGGGRVLAMIVNIGVFPSFNQCKNHHRYLPPPPPSSSSKSLYTLLQQQQHREFNHNATLPISHSSTLIGLCIRLIQCNTHTSTQTLCVCAVFVCYSYASNRNT